MADFGAPVAGQNNPNQGIQTLSQLLGLQSKSIGIQQQQQTLQTGQSVQQSAEAEATVNKQSAQENQALAHLLQDPVANGLIDENGNPTKNSQKIVMQAAPTTGADAYGKIVNAARNKVEFNTSLNNLNTQERQEYGATIAGAAAGAKSPADIQQASDQLLAAKAGTPAAADYQKIADTTMHIINHVGQQPGNGQPGQEPWRQAALGMGRQVIGAQGVVGAGGIGNPALATNAANQNQNRNSITGELSAPQLSGGATNPSSPQVAGQTTVQTGTGNADVDRANEVSNLQQQSSAAIPLTKQMDALKDALDSGTLAKKISETGNYLGFSSVNEARSQLNQDLGKLKGLAVARAGTDSRAATLLEGYPSDTTPTNTFHADMDYLRGTARQNLARGSLLTQYQDPKKPNATRGFQAADNILTHNTNPLMHEYMALKPAERAGFYRRNFSTPEQAQAFKDQVNAIAKHVPNVLGQ
jgi:hypothetical protein